MSLSRTMAAFATGFLRRFFPRSDGLVVRVLEEILVEVDVAHPALVAADVGIGGLSDLRGSVKRKKAKRHYELGYFDEIAAQPAFWSRPLPLTPRFLLRRGACHLTTSIEVRVATVVNKMSKNCTGTCSASASLPARHCRHYRQLTPNAFATVFPANFSFDRIP